MNPETLEELKEEISKLLSDNDRLRQTIFVLRSENLMFKQQQEAQKYNTSRSEEGYERSPEDHHPTSIIEAEVEDESDHTPSTILFKRANLDEPIQTTPDKPKNIGFGDAAGINKYKRDKVKVGVSSNISIDAEVIQEEFSGSKTSKRSTPKNQVGSPLEGISNKLYKVGSPNEKNIDTKSPTKSSPNSKAGTKVVKANLKSPKGLESLSKSMIDNVSNSSFGTDKKYKQVRRKKNTARNMNPLNKPVDGSLPIDKPKVKSNSSRYGQVKDRYEMNEDDEIVDIRSSNDDLDIEYPQKGVEPKPHPYEKSPRYDQDLD